MIRLHEWDCGNELFVFCKSEATRDYYINKHKDIICLENDSCIKVYRDKDESVSYKYEGTCEYEDGDILSVLGNGIIQKMYDAHSDEIDLFITNKCNSNCIMCPLPENVRKGTNSENIEWIKKYINIIPEDVGYINITGGEPTLARQDLLDILDILKHKFINSDFQILTNGRSSADQKFLDQMLDKCPSGIRFAIPIHASTPEIHDAITQSPGSFKQTNQGIKNLLKKRQRVEVRIVISRQNLDYLYETAKYISNNYQGLLCVNYIGMEMMGNAVKNKDCLWINYDEAFKAAKTGIDLLVNNGIDVQLYNFPLCSLDKGYWHIAAKSITDYKVRFMDECETCTVKELCGGFFQSTKQVISPLVYPIRESYEE